MKRTQITKTQNGTISRKKKVSTFMFQSEDKRETETQWKQRKGFRFYRLRLWPWGKEVRESFLMVGPSGERDRQRRETETKEITFTLLLSLSFYSLCLVVYTASQPFNPPNRVTYKPLDRLRVFCAVRLNYLL